MASDIFARLGDIKGESADSKHKEEIEVLSYSWGVANAGSAASGSGGVAGKATASEITLVHFLDKASPALMKACATGTRLKDATITHRKAGKAQGDYLIVNLDDILITAVTQVVDPQSNAETVNLSFAKIALEYRLQKADGSLDAGVHFKYDFKTQKVF
jgi:type VI secretion system secreted protein Hcp